jgi:DNA-nicking Smr family endonuclease
MGGRRLTPDERTLWDAVARTVRPIKGRKPMAPPSLAAPAFQPAKAVRLTPAPAQVQPAPPPRSPTPMLDSSWEKRIRSGTLAPEMAIDLHGHNLSAAHARLNLALTAARAQGVRTMLVITGKPRKADGSGRGAIRQEIGHWLQTSPHADAIASVRLAHPRHGGDGALYLILRRAR